jgi:Gram-negative bacterial TonB protein C-terminal
MNALIAIAWITGSCAILFLGLSLAGRYFDWMGVDPQRMARARRISVMVLVVLYGLIGIVDRFERAEQSRSLTPDGGLILINSVQPVYPPLARESRVEGKVRFAAVVGVDGRVEELKLIEGNPLLVPATREAALQWTFTKPTAQGKPIKAKMQVEANFRLDPFK